MASDKLISAAAEYLCMNMCTEIPKQIDEMGGYKRCRKGCGLSSYDCIAFLDFKALDKTEYTVTAAISRGGLDFSNFMKSGSVEKIIGYLNSKAGVGEITASLECLCEKAKRYCKEHGIED